MSFIKGELLDQICKEEIDEVDSKNVEEIKSCYQSGKSCEYGICDECDFK